MNKELKYIRIRETREGFTEFTSDDVLSADDYLSLLENEPSYERRLAIITVMMDEEVLTRDARFRPQRRLMIHKYLDEMKTLKILNDNGDYDKIRELVIRYNIPYNRQKKIDEILGADTNSREDINIKITYDDEWI